jgi:amino acid adenylation domain-containing protein
VDQSGQYRGLSGSLYDLLADAVRRQPARVAIDFMGQQMTYAELARASDLVAGYLMRQGIRPGERVGFYFHKCFEALVCLFGLIRAGITYVPFDLQVPVSRIKLICRQCGIRSLIAGALPQGLSGIDWAIVAEPSDAELPGGTVIPLSEVLGVGPSATGPPLPPADGIANIIYTSGSTGEPKGVMITTESLMHYSKWGVETFGLTPSDRIANHAPYSFDLSTFDVFAAIRAGATMCPFPDAARGHPYRTARFIDHERITVWYSVPWCLVLMVLRGGLPTHDLSALRHVLFAGEVMPPEHLRTLMTQVPHPIYWNLYGPTETNVCTYHRVDPADLDDADGVPIGRPISDTRVWVVDETGRTVPSGQAGELLVAGPTVFAGYYGDERGTAERLVGAPDGDGLACKTGDRAIARGDGVLTFLGRYDRMVKVRGYRIELAEIEAVVAAHPAVAEAAVVAVGHRMRGTTLTGFVCLQDGVDIGENELSAFCRERLPRYMVPCRWRFFEDLPRNPHGKIDLASLAAEAT